MPKATDLKVFVPAEDFELSHEFYLALGWQSNWKTDGLAELELANQRFFLQNYFQKDWAHNFMLYINVDSAQEWYEHVQQVIANPKFSMTRINPPKEESHATVTYVWDPCGVLLHFAENRE